MAAFTSLISDPESGPSVLLQGQHALLSQANKLYIADPSLRKRRKKLQGSSGKMFSEGWIEFADKAVAKRVSNPSLLFIAKRLADAR